MSDILIGTGFNSTVDHVGSYVRSLDEVIPEDCEIVSKVNTRNGVLTRIVGENLPDYVEKCEPTLEDAYLYTVAAHSRS